MQGLASILDIAKILLVFMLCTPRRQGKVIAHLWPSVEMPNKTGSLRYALSSWLSAVISHTAHTCWSYYTEDVRTLAFLNNQK